MAINTSQANASGAETARAGLSNREILCSRSDAAAVAGLAIQIHRTKPMRASEVTQLNGRTATPANRTTTEPGLGQIDDKNATNNLHAK